MSFFAKLCGCSPAKTIPSSMPIQVPPISTTTVSQLAHNTLHVSSSLPSSSSSSSSFPGYMHSIDKINGEFLLRPDWQEIAEKVTKCPSIKKLDVGSCTRYTQELAQRIGFFLAKATFIAEVSLSSAFNHPIERKLNSKMIVPIAEVLKTNQSITTLDLSDSNIGDEGVLELIKAIDSNANSKIASLNLFCCKMTDVSTIKLIDLLHKKPHITWLNIAYNSGISERLVEEVNKILQERRPTKR